MESAAMAMLVVKVGWKLEAVVKVVRRSTVYAGTGRFRRRRRRQSFSFFVTGHGVHSTICACFQQQRRLAVPFLSCEGNDSLRRHVPRALRLNVNIGKYACSSCLFYIEHHCMDYREERRGCG